MKILAEIEALGVYGIWTKLTIEQDDHLFYGVFDCPRKGTSGDIPVRTPHPLSQAQAYSMIHMIGKVGKEPESGDWGDYIGLYEVIMAIIEASKE